MTIRDVDDLADEILPLGGPYDPDALRDAASLAAELVRRLNHATFTNTGLPYPSSIDRIVSHLHATVAGMPQLLGQLAGHLTAFGGHPGLYADEMARGMPAGEVVGEAVNALLDAGRSADTAAMYLNEARNRTARLGVHEDGPS